MNPIEVLYEDSDILVLNKPAGIIVNRSDTTKNEQTVQDWIEQQKTNSKWLIVSNSQSDFLKRAGIVHRIDKETSGILLVAKNPKAFEDLQRQFKERLIKKTYLALVHGKVIPSEGEISVPVGRLPWDRKKFGVLAGGKEAVTKYKVLDTMDLSKGKVTEPFSLLELYPKTGRTHQIRVHLKYFNHPIFADFLYAGRKTAREDRKILNRIFLHAYKIIFEHPATKKQIEIESPLPWQLRELLINRFKKH